MAESTTVVVHRIDMPFFHTVWVLVKFSFASALAFLLTSIIWIGLWVGFAFIVATLVGMLGIAGSGIASQMNAAPASQVAPR